MIWMLWIEWYFIHVSGFFYILWHESGWEAIRHMSGYVYLDKYVWLSLSIHLNEQALKHKLKKHVKLARKIFKG